MADNQIGRPTLLTAELEARLLAALRASPIKRHAAAHGGITDRSWHTWEAKGRAQLATIAKTRGVDLSDINLDNLSFEQGNYAHFALSVEKVRSDYLLAALASIQQAGSGIEATTTKIVETVDPATGTVTSRTTTTTSRVERAWQAHAWLVERQYPEFRASSKLEVSGPEGGPLEVSVESAAERLSRRLDEMTAHEKAGREILAELEAEPVDGSVETVDDGPRVDPGP